MSNFTNFMFTLIGFMLLSIAVYLYDQHEHQKVFRHNVKERIKYIEKKQDTTKVSLTELFNNDIWLLNKYEEIDNLFNPLDIHISQSDDIWFDTMEYTIPYMPSKTKIPQ